MRECEGDINDGVVSVTAGHEYVVHVVQVLCLTQLTCLG